MKSWAYLFLPATWNIEDLFLLSPSEIGSPIFSLRLYYKPFFLDVTLPIFFSNQNIWPEIVAHFSRPIRLFPSGVILKLKDKPFTNITETYLFIKAKKNQDFLWIGFSRKALQSIIHLLSGKPTNISEEDALLEELSHWFDASLSRPPLNFEEQLLSLSDRHLQWLLQWLLSFQIVSPDMLAAYIWSLDEKGKRLLQNLSANNRKEITKKIRSYHRQKTYRWADEVKYLLHHNLFQHPHGLAKKIRLFEFYSTLRFQQTCEELTLFLQRAQSWHDTICSLPPDVKSYRYSRISSRCITAYGSFVKEDIFLSWWQDIISRKGLSILQEDRAWWQTQPIWQRSEEAMRFLKSWFSLEAETIVQASETPYVLLSLSYSWQIEIIAREIGVASCIYALKPYSVSPGLLPPIMALLFEDILHDTIHFAGWGDYRIPEAQKSFLKAIYVLRQIGRL